MSAAAPVPANLPRDPAGAAPGDLVVARAWKYNGAPHWVVPGRYLGADGHGHWIYQPAGSLVSRPGHGHWAQTDAVCLVPASGHWLGTFYDDSNEDFRTYLDLSTQIGWRELARGGWEANSVDMDLDVVDSRSRGIYLDDEDEFAQHAAAMGYPPALVQCIGAEARTLLHAVGQGHAPFDGTATGWLARGRTEFSQTPSR
ncbi:hypothetical protein GCM10009715_28470 [Paeniglutamicibacter psychrophenolicus]|uniref:Protein associated with RNAse G/E n=1 Tax=Paeniglutamicibacter psychrophenolicus TaxID=257454 RepID=A0ABS4WGF9_9MICC|nr:protein associated with RNAse G/E [Paeniglutamicibacter psychrophenolicus]